MKKIVRAWLEAAEEDFILAQKAFELDIYRQVCFHAQQAVEKGLKAILLEKGIRPKRIHDLLELSKDVESVCLNLPASLEELAFLNEVYRFRYPPDIGLLPGGQPDKADAERALGIAKRILNWVSSSIA